MLSYYYLYLAKNTKSDSFSHYFYLFYVLILRSSSTAFMGFIQFIAMKCDNFMMHCYLIVICTVSVRHILISVQFSKQKIEQLHTNNKM